MTTGRARVVGPGRAGSALSLALERVGWTVTDPVRRGQDPSAASVDVDLLVLAVPDDAIAPVAAAVEPVATTVVAHLAGSLGLEVLEPHQRRAAIHPLVALPDARVGAARLMGRAWFGLAAGGDPLGADVVDALGGRAFDVHDGDRARYHAAAVIASNHLVALLGHAELVAPAGVPFEAYVDLVRATVENVAALGALDALTGPAARGDRETISRHLAALPPSEVALYEALSARCREMARR